MKKNLTQHELREQVFYDSETGHFYRKKARINTVSVGDTCGCVCKTGGYRYMRILNKTYKASALAFLYMTGEFPKNEVDHINGIKDDDSWSNLRDVPHIENMRNQRMHRNNRSGHPGVHFDRRDKLWMASIGVAGKRIHIGCFKDKEAAIAARSRASREFGFHENHGSIALAREGK